MALRRGTRARDVCQGPFENFLATQNVTAQVGMADALQDRQRPGRALSSVQGCIYSVFCKASAVPGILEIAE